jgi:hypothetical protein
VKSSCALARLWAMEWALLSWPSVFDACAEMALVSERTLS